MSRHFVESFFPSSVALIWKPLLPVTYHAIVFPSSVAELCPEVIWFADQHYWIRNPTLGIHAAVGIMLGFVGGVTLLTSKTNKSISKTAYSLALLSFGSMNAAALPLHCLLPAAAKLPEKYPVLWMMDSYWTGASSVALLIAYRQQFSRRQHNMFSPLQEWFLWILPGLVSCILFILFGNTLLLEQWYLIPTSLAGGLTFYFEIVLPCLKLGVTNTLVQIPNMIFVLAAVVALCGLALDATFCLAGMHQSVLLADSLMMATSIFAASNIGFVAILWKLMKDDVTKTVVHQLSIGTTNKSHSQ